MLLTKRIEASKNEIREKRNVVKLFRVKTPSFSVLRYSLYMHIRGVCHLHKPVEILVDKNLTTGSYLWRTELARAREGKGWNNIYYILTRVDTINRFSDLTSLPLFIIAGHDLHMTSRWPH